MKTNRPTLTDKKYLVPFVLITSLFFLWGFARAILDVLNKHFQNSLDISLTQSSLIQVTTYLGYFLMAIPAGWFINRQGYRRGVVFGLALFAFGALLFIPGAENLLCLSWSAIYNRLRTRILGDSCQPLCSRAWR